MCQTVLSTEPEMRPRCCSTVLRVCGSFCCFPFGCKSSTEASIIRTISKFLLSWKSRAPLAQRAVRTKIKGLQVLHWRGSLRLQRSIFLLLKLMIFHHHMFHCKPKSFVSHDYACVCWDVKVKRWSWISCWHMGTMTRVCMVAAPPCYRSLAWWN